MASKIHFIVHLLIAIILLNIMLFNIFLDIQNDYGIGNCTTSDRNTSNQRKKTIDNGEEIMPKQIMKHHANTDGMI